MFDDHSPIAAPPSLPPVQVYGDHAFELPPDHLCREPGMEPPNRRTLEETLAWAQEVTRAIDEGKPDAAVKAIITRCGVHFMSPFFKLWSGFTLEQIRLDLAHIIQVLIKRLIKALCGKRDPKEPKGKPGPKKGKTAKKKPSKAGGGDDAESVEGQGQTGSDVEEDGDGSEKEQEPASLASAPRKRKSCSVVAAVPARKEAVVARSALASRGPDEKEQEGESGSRRPKRRKALRDFVNLDDFESDFSGGEDAVLDLTGSVDVDVDIEPAGGELGDDAPGGHVDYEVDEIINEKGEAAQGKRQFLVLWKYWPRPTWQPASDLEHVSHEVKKWERIRQAKGWPNIDEKAQRRELATQERAEANRRIGRMRAELKVTKAADKFISQTLITPPGFSPRPSQLPCQRISSLKIWDYMHFVEVWGELYMYHLKLEPEVSEALVAYLGALRLLLKRCLGPSDRKTMHAHVLGALVKISYRVWPDTEQGCFLHLCLEIARDAPRWLPRKPNMLSKERCHIIYKPLQFVDVYCIEIYKL